MLRHTQLWLSSIALAALMASAGAQTWDETANRRRERGRPTGSAAHMSSWASALPSLTSITGSIRQQHGCWTYVPATHYHPR
jgi:hypothetical protein